MPAQTARKLNNSGFQTMHLHHVQNAPGWVHRLKSTDLNRLHCINFGRATDPTSGSGSLLLTIGRSVSKYIADDDNVKYYAQELKENTYNLTRMNLVMRGIKPDNIVTRNGDTLEEDWPYFDENDPVNTYNPLYVDAVVSNPPYSQAWDPQDKGGDPRYARFGLAPKGKADYAFLLHDLYHVKPDGIMAIVLPHGVLFRGGEEGKIRKNLIENNNIDTIIGLPANIFFGTGIPTIIMVLRQHRENTDVLIIDASKGFMKEGKSNKLRASDIKKIADTVIKRESIDKFSRVVSRDEIRQNEYNLNIPRYVDSSEKAESWDIYASMFGGVPKSEIDEMSTYWAAFPSLKRDLFEDNGTPYVQLCTEDIKDTVMCNSDVVSFKNNFKSAFATFKSYLNEQFIGNTSIMPEGGKMMSVNIVQEESVLSDEIFRRLQGVPLIDKYEAYQLLDDQWTKIAVDLEIIQTEGFDAIKKVDPNLVLKKKEGKEQEVQDGWIGHIIPFELVQATLLKEEAERLKKLESDLAEIPSEYEAVLDCLTEDEKETCSDQISEEGDAFVIKEVGKKIKELKADKSPEAVELRAKLEQVEAISKKEKSLKAKLKSDSSKLMAKTKETIESLTDEQATQLLDKKWIETLTDNLAKLPDTVIDGLVAKISALATKYETTYFEVENEIAQTEKTLGAMIDSLTGSDFDMLGLQEFKKSLL